MTEIGSTADGEMISVKVTIDGITKMSLCSSMHLVPDHEARLTRLITQNAAAAFLDQIHARDIGE